MSTSASIEIVEGKQAPHYLEEDGFVGECKLDKVVITEKGTQGDLPIVDFVMTAPDGKKFMMCLTGRNVTSIAAAIQGVNLRNHGNSDP